MLRLYTQIKFSCKVQNILVNTPTFLLNTVKNKGNFIKKVLLVDVYNLARWKARRKS